MAEAVELDDAYLDIDDLSSIEICSICLENIADCTVMPCGHVFCKECIKELKKRDIISNCSICRQNIDFIVMVESESEPETKIIKPSYGYEKYIFGLLMLKLCGSAILAVMIYIYCNDFEDIAMRNQAIILILPCIMDMTSIILNILLIKIKKRYFSIGRTIIFFNFISTVWTLFCTVDYDNQPLIVYGCMYCVVNITHIFLVFIKN